MAWTCTSTSNVGLVHNLKKAGYVASRRVEDAMLTIDRKWFVPSSAEPYQDSPQYLGHNATISAPHMHANALSTLEPRLQPGARVLDVGSGSGYLTTCMARMVGPNGLVVGIEHVDSLVNMSLKNLEVARANLGGAVSLSPIDVVVGDGRQGYSKYAPYDCIHVGAAADTFPQKLLDQLKEGGLLYIPEVIENGQQAICLYSKGPHGTYQRDQLLGVRYVPLTSLESQLHDL